MKKRVFLIAVAVLLSAVLTVSFVPKWRTQAFVALYHDEIEAGLADHQGVPADDATLFGYKYVNSWDGEHPITEFMIGARGFLLVNARYFGCYYSPHDVPAGFQNVAVELIPDGEDRWVWQGEGDNHGHTEKLMDHWYYFEAKF